MALGVCGLIGEPVLSRVMLVSNDETDPVLIHTQPNMVIIVLETPGMIVYA